MSPEAFAYIIGGIIIICAIATAWWGFFSGEGDIRKL